MHVADWEFSGEHRKAMMLIDANYNTREIKLSACQKEEMTPWKTKVTVCCLRILFNTL